MTGAAYVTSPIVFVDTETTGLYPALGHRPWEIALVTPSEDEFLYYPKVDLAVADPMALSIGGYYTREHDYPDADNHWIAAEIARRTAGKHIVGAVPSFDTAMLDPFLRENGYAPAWHYHLVDVEALAAGKLGSWPPWKSEELSRAVGVDPEKFSRHTAAGDAWWAKAIYEAVMFGCYDPSDSILRTLGRLPTR